MSRAYREYGWNMISNISFSSVSTHLNAPGQWILRCTSARYMEEATKGKCKRRLMRYQTCPSLAQERRRGCMDITPDCRLMEALRVEDPQSFSYLRMEPVMFDELAQRLGPMIQIVWRDLKSIIPRMRPECLEWSWNAVRLFRMLQECSQNTLRIPFDISSLRMHPESFAHEQNIPASHKNVPEYLECTQNSVRSFRMHFDCQRMHCEFSFRRHSGSFRHSCDCPIISNFSTACYFQDIRPGSQQMLE